MHKWWSNSILLGMKYELTIEVWWRWTNTQPRGDGCCSFSSSLSFCESMFSGLCHSATTATTTTTSWGERCANQLTRARRQLHLLEKRNELKNEGESNRMASTQRMLFCGSHERGWERHRKSIYTSSRTTAGERKNHFMPSLSHSTLDLCRHTQIYSYYREHWWCRKRE